jgi:hypothetical protein
MNTHGIPAAPWQLQAAAEGRLKAIVLPLLPQIETDEMGWKFWRSNVYETTLAFAPSEKPLKKIYRNLWIRTKRCSSQQRFLVQDCFLLPYKARYRQTIGSRLAKKLQLEMVK